MESSSKQSITLAAAGSRRPRLRIVTATAEHCFAVADDLRPDDAEEIRHAVGLWMKPGVALDDQRMRHEGTMAALLDGEAVAIFGCFLRDGKGVPWLIGSRRLDKYPLKLTRAARTVTRRWKEAYGVLENVVWAESKAVAWLELVGFALYPPYSAQCADGSLANYRRFRM